MELTLAQPSFWGSAYFPVVYLGTSSQRPSLNLRGTADLFAISRRVRLVQSFEDDLSAPVPQVWKKCLVPSVAPDRWTGHGRGIWWLIWLDDGEPVLALPNASDPSSLDLLFAYELHRSSFEQLPTLK